MTDEIFARFLRDTADHAMTIAHDDGLYRHLKFRHTGKCYSGYYWFDLITVPGALIFQGDGDSFVFSRVPDMFEFFRSPVGRINPVYWGQKLTSRYREDAKTYDEEFFKKRVAEAFVDAARYGGVPAGTGKALREQVLNDPDIYHESGARTVLEAFEHKGFRFSDTWEWDLRDWDWWFLWCLHAIVWGIAKYDGRPVPTTPPEPVRAAADIPSTVSSRSMVTVELPGGGSGD